MLSRKAYGLVVPIVLIVLKGDGEMVPRGRITCNVEEKTLNGWWSKMFVSTETNKVMRLLWASREIGKTWALKPIIVNNLVAYSQTYCLLGNCEDYLLM